MNRKKTRVGLPAKGRLRDMADDLWSLAVRSDWNHQCAVCGKSKCEAHHLIPRENEATRYDLSNGIALCATHHKFCPKLAPHKNLEAFRQWLDNHHPLRMDWLRATVANGRHLAFAGTKNHGHYIAIILRLQQYVEPDDFTRIVGVRLENLLRGPRILRNE